MKKLIGMIIVLLSFGAFPATGDALYRIRLHNGGEFKTSKYWNEGNQIQFYFDGGIAGIQKSSVRKIEMMAPENVVYAKPYSEPKTAEVASEKNVHDGEKKKVAIDIPSYIRKKDQLAAELERTLERVRKASSNRDPEAKKRAENEMRRLSGEITALTEEVKGKNNGALPEGWMKER